MYKNPTLSIDKRTSDLLAKMTLAEKLGQMAQVDRRGISPDDVTQYCFGSILSGGGSDP